MINPLGLSIYNLIIFVLVLAISGYIHFILKKRINLFYLLIILSILPIISIFREGSYESSDLTLHTHYLESFFESLKYKIIIPQWSHIGYGTPVFIFLYPLPFYLGSIVHILGFSFLTSMKIVMALSYIFSGIGMYLFIKNEFDDKAAFASAIFFLFAPFHFVDLHFRASVGETLSFTFIPFIFLFISRYLNTKKIIYLLLTSISFAFLATSHLATSLIIFHILFLFVLIKAYQAKSKSDFFIIIIFIFFGAALSAFYWIPALLEVKNTLIYLTLPTGGFLNISELLYSKGRMFIVFQGNNGETQYLIGYMHILMVITLIIMLLRKKIVGYEKILAGFLIFTFLLLSFMTLKYSKIIWELISYLNNFQFAWRLLVPIAFIISFIAGVVVHNIKKVKIIYLIYFITIIITIPNWGNRKMVTFPQENRAGYETLYTEFYDHKDPEYRKIYGDLRKVKLREIPTKHIEILSGNAEIKELIRIPNKHVYLIHTKTKSTFKENTHYFLGWKVYVNNQAHEFNYKNKNYRGVIVFSLNPGMYKVEVKMEDTKVRKTSKMLSYASILLFIVLMAYALKKNTKA